MNIVVCNTLKNVMINLRQLGLNPIGLEQTESLHDIPEELDGVILDGNWPYRPLANLLEEAREHSLITSIDHIPEEDKVNKKRLLEDIDIFCPNKDEMIHLCGETCTTLDEMHREIKNIIERGTRAIAVTMGNDGVFFATKKIRKLIPAYIVAVADEEGAGDAFIAGIFYGLSKNYSMEKSIHCGIAAGSITVASYGDTAFELKPENLENIIENRVKK
ncbi:PfkB family carbohydrate kinase [Irregularibacter muris]|uniref:PfkB family carbohydrate kinase n=1 Tax=Irregularibacter muris TaxID=1796619 RepID=A0AAE3HE81_9FIRM|nr:PfkB family carbohydrate kinase [Irregularibacter muris]MCR1897589.1 PfkB family carbohydrate kinase [Irregularibacter muris]